MSMLGELKRRNVLRVGAAYAALSWLAIQIVETLFPLFGLSDSAARIVVVALAIGFLPAVVIAWAFEFTPSGLKRDSDVDRDSSMSRKMTRRLDRSIMLLLVLAVAYFAVDKFVLTENTVPDQSIAVLPFDDLSPDSNQVWFSDGISEELLNLLAKVEDLRVISRSSSFALRDDGLSMAEMAERLNVSYVLEGSVRKEGDRIRISAQLIDARTDTNLWSESYDRKLDDVFGIQDQISAQVVRQLKVRILDFARKRFVTDSDTHELYLRGLGLLASRGDYGMRQSIELFEQVISLDEDYAPAYGSLAVALVWSDLEDELRASRIEDVVARALELDPDNPDALASLGRLRFEQERFVEARQALERAIEDSPNHAMAYRWLGQSYSDADPVRYLAMARKAFLLNPLDPSIRYHTSFALSLLGRYDEALSDARELAASGQQFSGNAQAARAHFLAGRVDAAILTNFLMFRATGQDFGIARLFINLNDAKMTKAWFGDSMQSALLDRESMFGTAQVLLFLGEKQRALDLFADSIERFGLPFGALDVGVAHVLFDGDFDVAREAFEKGLVRPGQKLPQFEADRWPYFVHYALSLQRTGEVERAEELIGEMKQLVTSQLDEGVVVGPFANHLQNTLGRLHAMSGDSRAAVIALRRALEDGYLCAHCLRTHPHFDSLREEPDFIAVLAEYDAKIAIQMQGLAAAGYSLTPEELLALEEFDFDPFSR